MLNFFKENGYTIFKMMVNQIGMTMFGLTLSMATYRNDMLLLLTCLFSIGFYMVLLYTMSWDCGLREKVRVDGNRMKYQPLKGLWMSLCANVINFILAICTIVSYYSLTDFATGQPEGAYTVYYITKMIAIFIQGMYNGIISLYAPYNPFAFLAIIVPALVSSTLGYYLGLNNRRLLGFISKAGNHNKDKISR